MCDIYLLVDRKKLFGLRSYTSGEVIVSVGLSRLLESIIAKLQRGGTNDFFFLTYVDVAQPTQTVFPPTRLPPAVTTSINE